MDERQQLINELMSAYETPRMQTVRAVDRAITHWNNYGTPPESFDDKVEHIYSDQRYWVN